MSILIAFRKLFDAAYSGQNPDRDFQLLQDYYFPPQAHCPLFTLQELANRHAGINTRERVRQIRDAFEENFETIAPQAEPIINFQSELMIVYSHIEEYGCYLSLKELSSLEEISTSLAGVFRLGYLVNLLYENTKTIDINKRGFIVPDHVTQQELIRAISSARKAVIHYGSVFPFSKLSRLQEWEFIPSQHRVRFAKELLSSEKGYIELGEGDFFGFFDLKRDRLLSRLIQIFSVYQKVPSDNLVQSLHRTIKKRIFNDENVDFKTLEECSDVFEEYCLRLGYCQEEDNYLFASPELNELIKKDPPEKDKMFIIECKLVRRLQENGGPMFSNKFVGLMSEVGATDSHIMEFASLIYRTGFRRNSWYHTLDDRYFVKSDVERTILPADRNRIEINRIIRDTRLTKQIKRLCQNQCQLCGTRIQIGEEEFYSEAHHVRPLGDPHNGPDRLDNMLCVCPNCHVMLDYGAIPLNFPTLHLFDVNPIAMEYIDYHNDVIFHQGMENNISSGDKEKAV